jgi:hypothetical protein
MESIAEVFLPLQTMNIKNIVVNPPISVYPIRTPIATILYNATLNSVEFYFD